MPPLLARRSLAAPAALAASLLVALACRDAGEAATHAVRTDSAGVALVVNDSVDRPLAWTFTPRFSLGGEESGPQAFYGVTANALGSDARSNLYVLDRGNHRVVVFDSTGAFVREQGGEGGGPGELQFPAFLVVHPDGATGVYDYSREGLVRWSAAGEPAGVEVVTAGGGPPPQLMRAIAGGRVVEIDDVGSPESETRRSVLELHRVDGGGVATASASERPAAVTLAAIEAPTARMHMYRSCSSRLGMSLGPLFEPQLVWTTAGDRVLVARDTAYTVDVHDGARLVRSIRRAKPARVVTREMAVAELGEGMKVRFGGGQCTLDPDEVIEARGMAPVLQPVEAIAVAPDGTVWVSRGVVKGEAPVVDVFDGEGEYLGTLPTGAPQPAAFLPNGDLVAVEKDDMDVERVAVYRIDRTATAR